MTIHRIPITDRIVFRILLIFIPLVPGALAFWPMQLIDNNFCLEWHKASKEIAAIISTAIIALIGLMAATLVIVTSIKDSYYARVFENSGHKGNFLTLYFSAIAWMFLTHLLSIFSVASFIVFELMVCSFFANLIEFFLIIIGATLIAENGKKT